MQRQSSSTRSNVSVSLSSLFTPIRGRKHSKSLIHPIFLVFHAMQIQTISVGPHIFGIYVLSFDSETNICSKSGPTSQLLAS